METSNQYLRKITEVSNYAKKHKTERQCQFAMPPGVILTISVLGVISWPYWLNDLVIPLITVCVHYWDQGL